VLPPLFPCDGAGVEVSVTRLPVPPEFGPRLSPAAPPPEPPGDPSLVGAFSDAPPKPPPWEVIGSNGLENTDGDPEVEGKFAELDPAPLPPPPTVTV